MEEEMIQVDAAKFKEATDLLVKLDGIMHDREKILQKDHEKWNAHMDKVSEQMLSFRDHCAIAAMQGICTSPLSSEDFDYEIIAEQSYEMADAMEAERAERLKRGDA